MRALNEGVRWHRARACGETSPFAGEARVLDAGADGDGRAAAASEGVSRKKAKASIPRRAAGRTTGKDVLRGESRDALPAARAEAKLERQPPRLEKQKPFVEKPSNRETRAFLGLDRKSRPDDAEEDEDLRAAWIAFAFLWGAALTYVTRVACGRSNRGGAVVRRRVGGLAR